MNYSLLGGENLESLDVWVCMVVSDLKRYQQSSKESYRKMIARFLKDHMTRVNRTLIYEIQDIDAFEEGFSAQATLEDLFREYDQRKVTKIKNRLKLLCERLELRKALELVNWN